MSRRRLELPGTPAVARRIGLALTLMAPIAAMLGFWLSERSERVNVAKALLNAEPSRAPQLIRQFGCSGCHTIPGVAGADGKVGPPLGALRQRVFIAGVARNSPENLVQFIVSPQSLSPNTAMPATGVSEDEARVISAYLYAN